jgi:membrane protein DedA with SNARE-associated domain
MMVAVEGMGIPLPGEVTLIIAAILAGKGHDLNITGVVAAAALGAVIGDNTGFWLGRWLGYRILFKHGHYVRLTERRIKLGQYLFLRWGAAVVFCARFYGGSAFAFRLCGGCESHALATLRRFQCGGRNGLGDRLWWRRLHTWQ